MKFDTILKTLVKKSGRTVSEIANQINCHRCSIYRWMRGELIPEYWIIKKIARCFNVDESYLLKKKQKLNPETVFWNETEWKKIPGYNDYYVSKNGEILSCKPHPRRMRLTKSRDGHLSVELHEFDNARRIWVHRAVLMAWNRLPKIYPEEECRHLNGNPEDNRIENLEWGTQLENASDRRNHGRLAVGEDSIVAKLTNKDVIKIRERYSAGGITQKKLSKEYHTSEENIRSIINRRTWKHI